MRACLTALVGSVASSKIRYCTGCPPSVFGSTLNVFLYGMPSEAPGPVAPVITPTLTWAAADNAKVAAAMAASDLRNIVVS